MAFPHEILITVKFQFEFVPIKPCIKMDDSLVMNHKLWVFARIFIESEKGTSERNGSHQFEEEMPSLIFDSVGKMESLMNHWVQS